MFSSVATDFGSWTTYENLWKNGNEIYINELGHVTKMAAMPIYGKNYKNPFSRTKGLITLKHGM